MEKPAARSHGAVKEAKQKSCNVYSVTALSYKQKKIKQTKDLFNIKQIITSHIYLSLSQKVKWLICKLFWREMNHVQKNYTK